MTSHSSSQQFREKRPLNISIITTCKSRLHHLKQVIHSWINFKPHEIIVVDVKSPDGLSKWLCDNHPTIKIKNLDLDGFNVSKARNYGAKFATGEYLLFLDADSMLNNGLLEWFTNNVTQNTYVNRYRENVNDGIHEQGILLCSKNDFFCIEGYDEVFSGYGGEDQDILDKLANSGCKQILFPKPFAYSLPHSDEERLLYYSRDKKIQTVINRIYRSTKSLLLSREKGRFELNIDIRKKVMFEIEEKIGDDINKITGKEIQFSTNIDKWLNPPHYLNEKITIKFEVKNL